ncbi:hypothetical protein DFH05DRAFT_1463807 [Lentinula detonsa]|uniref:Uncharacterized protein n=1 Tax=Lentinula detonsa TaxID=2804962 RepID=A0A9W8NRL6_9AGAR|nr:hypothetical protein DFH05DRAFT_1463807 [Lentinula detonsa]
MPVDASGSDRLNMRSVKEYVNGVNGNSGANGAHSNSGTNGVHSNSGTNGVHSNPEPNDAHSHLEQSTNSNNGPVRIAFLPPAGGPLPDGSTVLEDVFRRVDRYIYGVDWLRLPRTLLFTSQYILQDHEAEFIIQVTADGRTEEYTIPRDPHPPHP